MTPCPFKLTAVVLMVAALQHNARGERPFGAMFGPTGDVGDESAADAARSAASARQLEDPRRSDTTESAGSHSPGTESESKPGIGMFGWLGDFLTGQKHPDPREVDVASDSTSQEQEVLCICAPPHM